MQKEISAAKANFEKQLAEKIKDNPKAYCSYSQSELKTKDTVGPKVEGNVIISDDFEIASVHNSYFCSKFTNDNSPMSETQQIFKAIQTTSNLAYLSLRMMSASS